ncbi:MAG: efflux RND transporter permease subunit [Armatimonadetes bacterium]|nr:efflux RND transporter permease subunit [Armatimonadota bacterium]
MWLTNLAIKRPVAILMLIGALLVMGLQGFFKMPAEQDPRVEFPFVTVSTVYPGAGPGEIETLVTKPIEDAVGSVNGVKNVTSTSQQGISTVAIEFLLSTNADVAAADVRGKVDAIRARLPREVDAPTIQKANTSATPILYMAMRSKIGRSNKDVRDLADRVVKDQLGQVSGVSSVIVTGGDKRELRVSLDKNRLDAYGLTVSEVATAIQSQNLNAPSGRVTEGNRDYSVRVIGEFASPDELRGLRLSFGGKNGSPDRTIALTDLGTVEDTIAERTENASLSQRSGAGPLPDSTDTVSISIQKTSEGNTVDIAKGVQKQMLTLAKLLPEDIEFTTTQDKAVKTEENLKDVEMTLVIGALLAITIVFFFLHNFRGTLIVALSIPTSIIATFLVMYGLGFTLNSMTLLGLSLAVGILVDDSIVVIENIYRHLAMGETPEEAARNGRNEIGTAAVTITLVDVVIFVPVAFMGGIVGQFFRSFGLTVAIATLFSLFMSFTLAPMLASRWYRKGEYQEPHEGFFGAINRFYGNLETLYERALTWALRHRGSVVFIGNMALVLVILWIAAAGSGAGAIKMAMPLAMIQLAVGAALVLASKLRKRFTLEPIVTAAIGAIATIVVTVLAGQLGKPLGFRFAPGQDQGQVALNIELPAGASLDATSGVLKQIESRLRDIPEIQYIESSAGSTAAGGFQGGGNNGTNFGQVRITLTDNMGTLDRLELWKDHSALRTRSDVDIAGVIRERVKDIPGADIKTAEVSGFNGSAAPVQIEIVGPSMEENVANARKVRDILAKTPGILTPDISYKATKPEVQVVLDRERAAQFGLSVQQVSGALRDAIEGNINAKFRDNGEQYDIRVQYDKLDRSSVADVGNVIVSTKGGQPIRVSDLAQTLEGRGPTKIDRKNRQRQITVTAYLAPGLVIGNMQQKIDPEIKKLDFGKAKYQWGGEANTLAEEGVYMATALVLAITLVYMLMAALFNNFLYPLIVMFSIPQALVGGLLGLIITGKSLSIIAMIGFIMLMGLVGKNAILLVDFTNSLRERGYQREDAIRKAGPTRLRPIIMTTLAQILGAMPIAMALGKGSEFRQPLGIVVVGGLCLSALLTLLVIPCVYTVFDDIGEGIGRLKKRITRR